MSKGREFWIWLSNGGLVADTEKRPFVEKEVAYMAHVIEYSAFEALQKENERLKGELKNYRAMQCVQCGDELIPISQASELERLKKRCAELVEVLNEFLNSDDAMRIQEVDWLNKAQALIEKHQQGEG